MDFFIHFRFQILRDNFLRSRHRMPEDVEADEWLAADRPGYASKVKRNYKYNVDAQQSNLP